MAQVPLTSAALKKGFSQLATELDAEGNAFLAQAIREAVDESQSWDGLTAHLNAEGWTMSEARL